MERSSLDKNSVARDFADQLAAFKALDIPKDPALLLDFDGTITNIHTYLELDIKTGDGVKKLQKGKALEYFADLELLKLILQKCKQSEIPCYIVSNQRKDVIEEILNVAEISYGHSSSDIREVIHNVGISSKIDTFRASAKAADKEKTAILIDDDTAQRTISGLKECSIILPEEPSTLHQLGTERDDDRQYGLNVVAVQKITESLREMIRNGGNQVVDQSRAIEEEDLVIGDATTFAPIGEPSFVTRRRAVEVAKRAKQEELQFKLDGVDSSGGRGAN
jgi:hypothetical protein